MVSSYWPRILRLDHLFAIGFGLFLIPLALYQPQFKFLALPLYGNYRLTLFEVLALPFIYFSLIYYGFSNRLFVKRDEKWLFWSIVFVICSRILSLLFAETYQSEQLLSILRYLETLVIIYFLAHLFTDAKNRSLFIWALFFGVLIETIGGLYIFIKTHLKGVFISNASVYLQSFFLIACLTAYLNKKHRVMIMVAILILISAILAALNRSALIFLLSALLFLGLLSFRKKLLKSYIAFLGIFLIGIIIIGLIWPSLIQPVLERIQEALHLRGGGITYRLYFADKALGAFFQRPLTGIGSGGFSRQLDELPQAFNFRLDIAPEYKEVGLFGTHNLILNIIAETGLLGLISYLLWFISILVLCINTLRSPKIKNEILIISTSIFIIALLFLDFYGQASFNPIINTFLGFLLGWRREKLINSTNSNANHNRHP